MPVSQTEDAIASFTRPPIVEVVASVRFGGLSDVTALSLGEFWRSSLAPDLEAVSLQPPFEAPTETFEPQFRASSVEFGFLSTPPVPRLWFSSATGQELVQLQPNWFAVNWRSARPDGSTSAYDRWPRRRESFKQRWTQFRQWAASRGEVLVPDQCEISYINHIRPIEGVWRDHASSARLFSWVNAPRVSDGSFEQYTWQAQFRLSPVNDVPTWRLHVSVQPAFNGIPPNAVPIVVLQITARGAPGAATDEAILRSLQRGRAAVVRSFLAMTSEEARQSWGQQ